MRTYVIDKTKMEAEAIEYAGKMGGEIINEFFSKGIGGDIYKWTPEQYAEFVEGIITGFVERMQELKVAMDCSG